MTFLVLSITSLIVIAGFRENVGRDYEGYKFLFDEQGYLEEEKGVFLEPGFQLIINILKTHEAEVWSLFLVTAIITWVLFYFSFYKHKKLLHWGLFFAFIFSFYFFSFNGMRQAITMAALGLAVNFIIEKKIIPYFIIILLGYTIHQSLILFLPLYFVLNRIVIHPRIWNVLFLVSVLLHFLPNSFIINTIDAIYDYFSFAGLSYKNYIDNFDYSQDTSLITLGYLFRVLIGIIMLIFYPKIIKTNPETTPLFTLAFIGAFLYNAFPQILLIARINNYFTFFNIFVFTFIMDFMNKKNLIKEKFVMISILLLVFMYNIYVSDNYCSPFQFISLNHE